MAHERAVEPLVGEALADGDGDLAAELDVFALGGAVHGAVADGEGVDLGVADELDRGERVGVGARRGEDVVLDAGEHAELALDGDAARVRVLDDLARELHVLLERKRRAVDHDGGVAAGDGRLHALHVTAVVEVQDHGDGAVLAVLLDGVADVPGADDLVLDRAVGKVRAPSHEGVGEVGALQDGGAPQHLVDLDHGLCLADGVDVERALGVAAPARGVQDGLERNECHVTISLFVPGSSGR